MRRIYKAKNFGDANRRIIQIASQIAEEYAADGYDLTLRQLYYQFVARGYIANRQSEYKRLGSIVNDARLAGLIDWGHLVDRTRNLQSPSVWDDPEHIIGVVARSYRLSRWDDQPVRVEVWVEKEALAGVVAQACEPLGVPWFACRGYVSQSELWSSAQRLGRYLRGGQQVVVLHLGDHDPSGIDMTRDNRERLNDFIRIDAHHALNAAGQLDTTHTVGEIWDAMDEHYGSHRVDVRRIALNMDQIDQYDPPPNPAKLTDSRVGNYLVEYGSESWELDALPPDVLSTLIRDEAMALVNDELWLGIEEREAEETELLERVSARWADVRELVR
jgi:hypothetical protein